MPITASLDENGRDLVLIRIVPAARDLLWDDVSSPELLASWFGTYTGDPTSGSVLLTMNAESGDVPAETFTIHACEPRELLTVSSGMGEQTWRLTLTLADAAVHRAGDSTGADAPAPGAGLA